MCLLYPKIFSRRDFSCPQPFFVTPSTTPNHPGHELARLTLSLNNLYDLAERFVSSESPSELESQAFSAYETTCWKLYKLLRDKYHIEEAFFELSLFPEEFQPILAAAIKAQDRASYLLAEYWTPERSAERFEQECKALVEECTESMEEV